MPNIKTLYQKALKDYSLTDAEILLAKSGKIKFHKFFSREKTKRFFDLASLTKPIVVSLLMIKAFEKKIINPGTRLIEIMGPSNLSELTILEILEHRSGLVAWFPFYENKMTSKAYQKNKKVILSEIYNNKKYLKKNKKTVYSDLGYMVLGEVLEKLYKMPIEKSFAKLITKPLGIEKEIFYLPIGKSNSNKMDFIATETCEIRKKEVMGEVMDRNCYVMGGVSGHAGLFGTAKAIHKILLELRKSYLGQKAFLKKDSFMSFFIPNEDRDVSQRNFCGGFDTPTKPGSLSGRYFSKKTIGHLGYSGTSFWWDLKKDLWVVVLTNRCYFGRGRKEWFRPKVHNLLLKEFYYK